MVIGDALFNANAYTLEDLRARDDQSKVDQVGDDEAQDFIGLQWAKSPIAQQAVQFNCANNNEVVRLGGGGDSNQRPENDC